MPPLPIVAVVHLGFQEASECAVTCPPDSVAVLLSAFDDDLGLQHLVDVDPDALAQDGVGDLASMLVLR